MSGAVILGVGIGMIVLAVILLAISIVYVRTAGRRMREEFRDEYG